MAAPWGRGTMDNRGKRTNAANTGTGGKKDAPPPPKKRQTPANWNTHKTTANQKRCKKYCKRRNYANKHINAIINTQTQERNAAMKATKCKQAFQTTKQQQQRRKPLRNSKTQTQKQRQGKKMTQVHTNERKFARPLRGIAGPAIFWSHVNFYSPPSYRSIFLPVWLALMRYLTSFYKQNMVEPCNYASLL